MKLSLLFHILILSCAVYCTWGLSCLQGGDGRGSSGKAQTGQCDKSQKTCFVIEISEPGENNTLIQGCDDKPVTKCEKTGQAGQLGPARCNTDNCNTRDFLIQSCSSTPYQIQAPSYSTLFTASAAILQLQLLEEWTVIFTNQD